MDIEEQQKQEYKKGRKEHPILKRGHIFIFTETFDSEYGFTKKDRTIVISNKYPELARWFTMGSIVPLFEGMTVRTGGSHPFVRLSDLEQWLKEGKMKFKMIGKGHTF